MAWTLWGDAVSGAAIASAEGFYLEAMKVNFGLGGPVDEDKAKELYLHAAERGDPRAQAWKARHMYRGIRGFQKNPEEAERIFRDVEKALQEMADRGLPDAQRSLALSWAVFYPREKGKAAFRILQELSKGKSPVDWGTLAWAYEKGVIVKGNPAQAFAWYKKSAEAGNVNSMSALGDYYEQGLGVSKNLGEALRWYRESAERGHVWAQRRLGFCLEEGIGGVKDEKEAVRWYQKAADQGDGWALNRLGLCHENGRGVEQDPTKAFAHYLRSAEAGDDWGQNNAGNCYRNGYGTPQDLAKAVAWYEKSSAQGNASAMENLGQAYARGQGAERNEAKALEYFQKAAEKGSVWAQTEVGRYFVQGIGTKKDKKIALFWFRKAADQGNAYAQSWVGYAIEGGWEDAPDLEEAMRWYRKSAEGGHAWSWAALGACLQREGKFANQAEAVKCFQKANWAGDAWGTRLLADAYAQGVGISRDRDLAASLYERVVSTSEGRLARQALVDLHWGGTSSWKGANLQKGMEHWLVLHSEPSGRIREIHDAVKRLLQRGNPGSAAAVLDLFESSQNQPAQALPANLKIFRAGCRLMADRHVPETWSAAIPSFLQSWALKLQPYLREENGGCATLSSGTLEVDQKNSSSDPSGAQRLVGAWQNHLKWLFRLWAEEESGWYRSFVRSMETVDRPVNLRWLEAGVTRKEEAWRDVVDVSVDQLSLPAVGGALIVSLLQENPARSKDLLARLQKLESKEREKQAAERDKNPKKHKSQDAALSGLFQQVRSLAETGLVQPRWWAEKGEISFGFSFSSTDPAYGISYSIWQALPPIQAAFDSWNRLLCRGFVQSRPDLVLRLAKLSEFIFTNPEYNLAAYGFWLDRIYEFLAQNAPSVRSEAIQNLIRWSRFRGNEVTADRWEQSLHEETSPKKAQTEASIGIKASTAADARIPEKCKENAARAIQLYTAGKMEEAIAEYETILRQYPDSLFALSNLGVVRFQQKKYGEAEKALREALRLYPDDAFSNSVLGVVLFHQEKFDEAEKILRRAADLDPQDARNWNYLGIVCFRKGQREEARPIFIKAVALDPQYGDAHFNLATFYVNGTPEEKRLARKHYQRAKELNVPADPSMEQLLK